MRKQMTLCIVQRPGQVLLGMKKRGFGEGRWNGFGGKVHEGETVWQAAVRELAEEAGITAVAMEERALLEFSFADSDKVLEVHLFNVSSYAGEPRESEEMRPHWFAYDDIPFNEMWPDDELWMPLFLAGKHFTGKFRFKSMDDNSILSYELKPKSS